MANVMLWSTYERFIWGIAITLTLICGVYFIIKGRKREIFSEKIIMFGLASLPLGFASSLVITFIQVTLIPGYFNPVENIFYGDYENFSSIYIILEIISNAILGLGGMFFVLAFDVIFKRTKFAFTIAFGIFTILVIIFPSISTDPLDVARPIFNFFILGGLVILVPIVLYHYTERSRLEFKAVSSFFLFGFLLFMFSLVLALRAHKSLNIYRLELSPLLLILGCCIIIIPTVVKPKIIRRALLFWVLFALLAIPLIVYIIVFDISFSLEWQLILEFFFLAAYVYTLFYLIIKHTRSSIVSKSIQVDEKIKTDVLGIFTRPQKLTEEEVIVSKEKKICLVCKTKISGNNFMCPECGTFYCSKCSKALSDLENVCWVCNYQIDSLKPIKPYEEVDYKLIAKKNSNNTTKSTNKKKKNILK
ncbi:MAG: hypothetical protein ACFFD5_13185 [Candidatus Thorarchaeota archaeon]